MTVNAAAELEKLAHQLGVRAGHLDCVRAVAAEDLRALRQQIGDALFEADRHHFHRMTTLARAVPVAVAAKVSEAVLPPLLAARTAELFEPHRAAEMVARMSDRYLADVAAAMDPARAPEVIAAIPAERVARVGSELARRGEWVVMGGFVSYVNPDALAAAVDALSGEQLLRTGFVMDDTDRLGEISELLRDDQIDDLLTAAASLALWRELDALLDELDDARTDRLARRFAVIEDPVRAACADAAESGLLGELAYERLSADG